MIVGDTNRFAVEFDLDPSLQSDPELARWLYGRIRWWCGGETVGIFEPKTTVLDVVVSVERIVSFAGARQSSSLIGETAEAIHRTVIRALYEDYGQSIEQMREDQRTYQRFLVRPEAQEFDPWVILLVEDETRGRLIWSSRDHYEFDALVPGVGVRETELKAGEFDDVQRSFLRELKSMQERLASP